MSIVTSFGTLFDKTLDPAFAHYTVSRDAFVVEEHDVNPKVKTRHLQVVQVGAEFASFNYMIVKSMGDITEKRSRLLKDHDCDGVTFMSHQGQDGLIFSELKSGFSTQKFRLMTHSFLKMHAMLSLCKDYEIGALSLHFIAACQCFEDKNQEVGVYNSLSKEEQLGGTTFVGVFLRKLIEKHDVKVKLGDVAAILNLPLSQKLADKEITLSLQVSTNYGEDHLVYTY